jgi:hypothetical protein
VLDFRDHRGEFLVGQPGRCLPVVLRRDPGRPSVRAYPRLLRQPVDADLLAKVASWLATDLSRR